MSTKTIRILEKSTNELDELYDETRDAVQKSVDGWLALRKYALHNLKGKFSKNELQGLCDIQNGTLLTPEIQPNPSVFIAHIEDAEQYEKFCEKWKIDYNKLVSKVKALSHLEVYFIQEEIARFWNEEKSFGSPSPDLNKFCKYMHAE